MHNISFVELSARLMERAQKPHCVRSSGLLSSTGKSSNACLSKPIRFEDAQIRRVFLRLSGCPLGYLSYQRLAFPSQVDRVVEVEDSRAKVNLGTGVV